MNTQNYAVNIRVGLANPVRVNISQGDTGRTLAFSLYDGLIPFTPPTGSTVTIVGRKPSKLGFTETCTVSGNVATVATTLAMTQEAGKFPAELRIEAGGQSIGTANFTIYIEPSPHPDGTTDGTHATVDNLQTQIGNLANLTTTAKTNLVSAINEAAQSGGTEVVIDNTLTQTGQAADAKKTGDEISAIKADLDDLDDRVTALEEGGGGGMTDNVKTALMNLVNHLAWDDDDPTGQSYIDALEDALYPPADPVVANTLVNCSTSNNSASVTRGGAYSATITPSSGCSLYEADIVITMGGVDITNTAYSNGTISIASVTGDLSITVTCYATIQWDKSKGRVPSSDDGITTTNTGVENNAMTEAFDSDKGIVITGTGSNLLRYDIASYQYVKKGTFEITFTVDSMANDSIINLRLTKDGTNGSNMSVARTAAKGYHIRYTKATNTSFDMVANSFNLNQEYTLKVDFDYNSNGKIMVYLDGTKVYETTTQSSYYANRNALIFTYTLKAYVKSFRWVIKEGTLNE